MATVFVRGPKGRIFQRVTEPVMTIMDGGMTIIEHVPKFYIDGVETELEEFKRQMDIDGVPKTSPKKAKE